MRKTFMKNLLAVVIALFGFAVAQAADFRVSKECRETIQNDWSKRSLRLTRIDQTTYIAGGSDGASSWDSEYIVNAHVKDSRNKSNRALIYINDSYSCRVLS